MVTILQAGIIRIDKQRKLNSDLSRIVHNRETAAVCLPGFDEVRVLTQVLMQLLHKAQISCLKLL